MRLSDARRLDPKHDFRGYDVCVIGAGAVGSYVAHRLAEQGARVLVLEAGGVTCVDGGELGITAAREGSAYRAASLGRAFGLGGTSARWGGQLVAYGESDAQRTEPHLAGAWRHVLDVILEREERVRDVLGMPRAREARGSAGPFKRASARVGGLGLELVTSDVLPFRQRNLSRLLRRRYPGRAVVDVCLHAMARGWSVAPGSPGARVDAVTVWAERREFRVSAPAFVLAAGALESARILLEMEAALPTTPFGSHHIGRGLSDHLSCSVARVPPWGWATLQDTFGPRFARGRLQHARLLEAAPPVASPRGFFHFIFEREDPAFGVARATLEALEARRWPDVGRQELMRSVGGLGALAWGRFVRSRLHVPSGTPVHLQLDIEQAPSTRRGVSLSDARDRFERRVARLDWDMSVDDMEHAGAATRRFAALWSRRGRELTELDLMTADAMRLSSRDAFHPTGVCRLGADPAATVDLTLRVRGMDNLWALSSGVFPSAGTANPGFSLLCLGEALASELAESVPHRRQPLELAGGRS